MTVEEIEREDPEAGDLNDRPADDNREEISNSNYDTRRDSSCH
jgi:hypothetical protein